jgi:hypothetical protein
MLGITKFELAILEFGVKEALLYFATPDEYYHLWDQEWQDHVRSELTDTQRQLLDQTN